MELDLAIAISGCEDVIKSGMTGHVQDDGPSCNALPI